MCTKAPTTVDYETSTRSNHLGELDNCLKKFNGALTATMNSYRDLLTAFDQMAQVFGNIAGGCSSATKEPVIALRDGMRDMKDKGPFVALNTDLHEGTLAVLDPVRENLKSAQKSLSELKSRQRDYDSIRSKLEKKEREYAKKDKPLTDSDSYKKDVERRDKSKVAYESKRESFEKEVGQLQKQTETVLLRSMNNYLHSTASFASYLETTLNSYRTDVDIDDPKSPSSLKPTQVDRLRDDAVKQSETRRRQSQTNRNAKPMTPSTLPQSENTSPRKPDAESPMGTSAPKASVDSPVGSSPRKLSADSASGKPSSPKSAHGDSAILRNNAANADAGYPTENGAHQLVEDAEEGKAASANPLEAAQYPA